MVDPTLARSLPRRKDLARLIAGVRGLAVEMRPVAELVPYASNARLHTAAQVAVLANSVRIFGWTNPVLIGADGGIVAGHGRVLAAARLGLAAVPCIPLAHLSPEQRRAYILADNRLAELAGWDAGLRAAELAELEGLGAGLGFSLDDVGLGLGSLSGIGPGDGSSPGPVAAALADRFLVAPFSVIDSDSAWWRARLAAWGVLGVGVA